MHRAGYLSTLAVATLFLGTTTCAFAETLKITDITGGVPGSAEISIPLLEADDTNLSEATIRTLFSSGIFNIADDLARLDAREIRIPEMTISLPSQKSKTAISTFSYRDISINDVSAGTARNFEIGSIVSDTGDDAQMHLGATTANDFNLAAMLGFYGLTEVSNEFHTLYRDFKFSGGSIVSEKFKCDIGSASVAEFRARPLKVSIVQMMDLFGDVEPKAEMTPEQSGAILKYYADILSAVESTPFNFSGLTCAGEDNKGRHMDIRFGGMSFGGFKPGWLPEMVMDGLQIEVKDDGMMALGNFTSKASNLNQFIAFLESAPELVSKDWLNENARKLVPAYRGFSFADFAMDIPNEKEPGTRIVANLAAFDLDLDDYTNNIPMKLAISGDGIYVKIPEGDKDLAPLRAAGIEDINASFAIAAHRNADDKTLNIEKVQIGADKLGIVTAFGTIGNVADELFSDNEQTAMFAAMAMSVMDVRLELTDAGIGDVLAGVAAKEQGQDPATIRIMSSAMAGGVIAATLKDMANATKISKAVAAFLGGETANLTVTAKAKSPQGLTIVDFAAAEDNPMLLLNKVDLDASN